MTMLEAEYARERQKIALRHKKEKADLDKANKLKKQGAKNLTKNEQKAVNKDITESQKILKDRHQEEIKKFDAENKPVHENEEETQQEFIDNLHINEPIVEKIGSTLSDSCPEQKVKKVSKAEKIRRKKAAEEAELRKRIEAAKLLDEQMLGKTPKFIESQIMRNFHEENSLEPISIPADGSCLFGAIIESSPKTVMDVGDLRDQISKYLRSHESDYKPFIEVDDFDDYTQKLSKGEIQGGEVEIRIASILLDISIEVVQWNEKNGIMKNNFEGGKDKIIISYYKHMMDTSAHYNGTKPK